MINYSKKLDAYKNCVKENNLDLDNESVLIGNELSKTSELMDLIFQSIITLLSCKNNYMDRMMFEALHYMEEHLKYLNFLEKRLSEINSINHGYSKEFVENLNKYVPVFYKRFKKMLKSLPAYNNYLDKSQVEEIMTCHEALYMSFGLDLNECEHELSF